MTSTLKAAISGVLDDFKGHPALTLVVVLNVLMLGGGMWYLREQADRTGRFVDAVIDRCLPKN